MFLLIPVFHAEGQLVQTEFGKNRIQYHDDFENWNMYETENFITYWYGKGRNIAHTVVQLAEKDNDEIRSVLEHRFNDKIEIIVYLDLSDLKQSNLGAEEVFVSAAGRTKILGNKMFVYFNGDHQQLSNQIRQGIASVYLESMLYGSNLQEVVQNAVLLNLPDWYKEGLVSFLGSEWDEQIDNDLRDIFSQRDKYFDFFRLSRDYPTIAGHAFWYFISKYYGKENIPNLLYLTRINRSLENGFLYVLGTPYEQITEEWSNFFRRKYNRDNKNMKSLNERAQLPIKNKRKVLFTHVKLSPDGKTLAYVMNNRGKRKLMLYDLETDRKRQVFKYGVRNLIQQTDENYPVLTWSDDGRYLAFIHEKRDIIYLSQLDLERNERMTQVMSPEIQRVYSMDYWSMDTLVLNATTDGLSDLYMYYPKRRASDRLTEDFYDDLDVSVTKINGTKGLLFSSNRTEETLARLRLDSILPIGPFNIFFLQWNPEDPSLRQLTFTESANYREPAMVGGDKIMFLSNESGVWNRKILTDLAAQEPTEQYITNYDRNIVTHHSTPGKNDIAEVAIIGSIPRIFVSVLQDDLQVSPYKVSEGISAVIPDEPPGDTQPEDQGKEYEPDDKYLFQSEFKVPEKEKREMEEAPEQEKVQDPLQPISIELFSADRARKNLSYKPSELPEFNSARIRAARLQFKLDYVNVRMDNNLLFGGLDSYSATKQEYEVPPLGILLKANIKDLFEDYVIEGGARFPTSFNGSEYFITFENRKKKLDRTYALYRKVTTETMEDGLIGIDRNQFVTVIGQYAVKYPLDVYQSFRATGTIRNDREIRFATDAGNLNEPIIDDQRIGLKLEYVYDNSIPVDVNMRHGTRAKIWIEAVKKFDLNLNEPGRGLEFNEGFMTNIGVDARHYVRLDRNSIFAARFTASTSFGSEQILYYLGGVENALFASYDRNIPIPGDKNFAYQTLAAHLRGFRFNSRNGASVALVNTELRVPFLKYLARRKIKSSFLRNLQVVGFFDVGTAWHGSDPFSEDNPLNTVTLTNPPTVQVDVKYFRNPIIYGYGAGLRALLFGYFLKLDYAWGWETNFRQDPILHFSIGTDF